MNIVKGYPYEEEEESEVYKHRVNSCLKNQMLGKYLLPTWMNNEFKDFVGTKKMPSANMHAT